MRTVFIILTTLLLVSLTKGQIARLDVYRGNDLTALVGSDILHRIQSLPEDSLIQFLKPNTILSLSDLKLVIGNCKREIVKYKSVNTITSIEHLESADLDNKAFFERTYYNLNANSIEYKLQIIIDLTNNGVVRNISTNTGNFINRDKIIFAKQNEKNDLPPPPPMKRE